MNAVVKLSTALDAGLIAKLVTAGDLSSLSPADKVSYYNYRCHQAGLDPAAKPFDLLRLNGKEVLYANASCAQQLCGIHKLSVEIVSREKIDDIYVVQARVKSPDGRSSDNMGAVPLGNLKGEALANAMLKGTTKAIRRTVLAHLGLGMLDETEVASIPGAQTVEITADPRGDLTQVDPIALGRHVSAVADVLAADADEYQQADMLRSYVDEHLAPFHEMYIAVADALAAQKILSKSQFKTLLKHRKPAEDRAPYQPPVDKSGLGGGA